MYHNMFQVYIKNFNTLNINKAYGHDDKSIWVIKLCSKSVVKPLPMIFKNFILIII